MEAQEKCKKGRTPDLPTMCWNRPEMTNRIHLSLPCFLSQALYDSLDGTGLLLPFSIVVQSQSGFLTSRQTALIPEMGICGPLYETIADQSK
jgi:hypothetical protein